MKLHLIKLEKAYLGVFDDPAKGRAMAEVEVESFCKSQGLSDETKTKLFKRIETHELYVNQINKEFLGDLEDVVLES